MHAGGVAHGEVRRTGGGELGIAAGHIHQFHTFAVGAPRLGSVVVVAHHLVAAAGDTGDIALLAAVADHVGTLIVAGIDAVAAHVDVVGEFRPVGCGAILPDLHAGEGAGVEVEGDLVQMVVAAVGVGGVDPFVADPLEVEPCVVAVIAREGGEFVPRGEAVVVLSEKYLIAERHTHIVAHSHHEFHLRGGIDGAFHLVAGAVEGHYAEIGANEVGVVTEVDAVDGAGHGHHRVADIGDIHHAAVVVEAVHSRRFVGHKDALAVAVYIQAGDTAVVEQRGHIERLHLAVSLVDAGQGPLRHVVDILAGLHHALHIAVGRIEHPRPHGELSPHQRGHHHCDQ